jgi:hypothetical protein
LTVRPTVNAINAELRSKRNFQRGPAKLSGNLLPNATKREEAVSVSIENMVDLVGIEPTTSSMPWKRAPNCATGPHSGHPIFSGLRRIVKRKPLPAVQQNRNCHKNGTIYD